MMLIHPSQCRAARGLLKWTQPRLANASGIGLSTINRYENQTRPPRETAVHRMKIALEGAGIEFISANAAAGIGVRLRNIDG